MKIHRVQWHNSQYGKKYFIVLWICHLLTLFDCSLIILSPCHAMFYTYQQHFFSHVTLQCWRVIVYLAVSEKQLYISSSWMSFYFSNLIILFLIQGPHEQTVCKRWTLAYLHNILMVFDLHNILMIFTILLCSIKTACTTGSIFSVRIILVWTIKYIETGEKPMK